MKESTGIHGSASLREPSTSAFPVPQLVLRSLCFTSLRSVLFFALRSGLATLRSCASLRSTSRRAGSQSRLGEGGSLDEGGWKELNHKDLARHSRNQIIVEWFRRKLRLGGKALWRKGVSYKSFIRRFLFFLNLRHLRNLRIILWFFIQNILSADSADDADSV